MTMADEKFQTLCAVIAEELGADAALFPRQRHHGGGAGVFHPF